MTPCRLAKVTESSKVGKEYLKVESWPWVPKGKRFKKVPKGPGLSKDTLKSKVGKGYLKVPGWQRGLKGPRMTKST